MAEDVAWSLLTGPARTATLSAVAAASAVLLVRVARIETRVSAVGVRVRNPFRRVEVGWDDVARADRIARGLLGHGLAAHRITAALRRTAAPAGVAVTPLHRDGPPPPHA